MEFLSGAAALIYATLFGFAAGRAHGAGETTRVLLNERDYMRRRETGGGVYPPPPDQPPPKADALRLPFTVGRRDHHEAA